MSYTVTVSGINTAEKPARRNLTDREIATILHALRVLQGTCALDDVRCDHFDECTIMSNEEIDALCESINLDDVSVSA